MIRDETSPENHPTWRPQGQPGHYCVAERFCACGHWRGGRYATRNADGKRHIITVDAIEGNDDGSR